MKAMKSKKTGTTYQIEVTEEGYSIQPGEKLPTNI